jgi:proteasome lid subunit RPN8/RPN11
MKERCGIIIDNKFFEIKNIAENDYEFVMDPKELYWYIKNSKLKAIVHTHVDSCNPSTYDIYNMKFWKVPWIIISKKCFKAFKYSYFGVVEIDVKTLISKELYDLIMKLLY